jgi:signal recognition particle subunit SRP68
LEVSRGQIQNLESTLRSVVAQYRGLVALEKITADDAAKSANQRPTIERLHEYSESGVDLNNLVPYPPQMQAIPVKPLFLDVAWNYIDYPREGTAAVQGSPIPTEETDEEKKGGRRGWFGFGR